MRKGDYDRNKIVAAKLLQSYYAILVGVSIYVCALNMLVPIITAVDFIRKIFMKV